ncbi:hypothetical protein Vadar_030576 [Vaccinium darrowii]|uniref:Uncharacterized protein n=1 Tax=Vaccinium darrowii TaxID=229202 RepID=A0ACB7YQK2_9ERIC|nr:hypothetical protein Vadar_030576 [Vaccinium darrowii]
MPRRQKTKVEGLLRLPPPASLTVILAIKGNNKSKDVGIVNWALDKFVAEGMFMFKLVHVRPTITTVPTAVGSFPLSDVRKEVVQAYKREIRWRTEISLLPYKKMCAQKRIHAEIVQHESDDVVDAISKEVVKSSVNTLVIGVSSRGMLFSRRRNLSSEITESIPKFCTVYAVLKGKLASLRQCEFDGSIKEDRSEASISTSSSPIRKSYSQSELTDSSSIASYASFPFPFNGLSTINQTILYKKANSSGTLDSRFTSLEFDRDDCMSSCPGSSDIDRPSSSLPSGQILGTDAFSRVSHQATFGDATTSDYRPEFSPENQVDVDLEIERLRSELKPLRNLYPIARIDAIDGSEEVNDLNNLLLEESIKLGEINYEEEEARELAIQEEVKCETARQEVEYVKEYVERETVERNEDANKALKKAKKKEKLENAQGGPLQQYQKFEWEDIVSATSNFSDNLKIGCGAYGTVYKCSLHHTTAAVKVLHSKEAPRIKQFQQELEVLSTIRHPHLLILLGACPDHGCLVYEHMENGSLEDRLFRRDNSPPIPWFHRYRIAWEIASTLVFLHSTNPQPIIHRDLKPANILLDQNFVSKIGDVGLSKMLDSNSLSPLISTMCNETGPVGTLCYIDPEYQRTGLICASSDVYAFGMVILQLVTAKPARALTHLVETASDEGNLEELFDPEAGNWPVEETKELVALGMRCSEMRRKDRPSLRDEVLPALERLKDIADEARNTSPILENIMDDPCVAADGYAYDGRDSPMTNLPLSKSTIHVN